MTAEQKNRYPYSSLGKFPTLFSTYCDDFHRLGDYFEADYSSTEEIKRVSEKVASHERNRRELVEVLLDQNEQWGLDDVTRSQIEKLLDPHSVAVVTGQQVGLLGGPLYTPLKTITAIQLAQKIEKETGRPAVPVFWLEGEDHDFEEVASVKLLRGNDLVSLEYSGHTLPANGNLGPVGRIRFSDQITDLVNQLEEILPPTDFRQEVMSLVRQAYKPGMSFRDAFAILMRGLFPDAGLVFISPDDVRLKTLVRSLFDTELANHAESHARLETVSGLLSVDFHAQVHPRSTNLFLIDDDGRYAIDAEGTKFRLHGTDRTKTLDELRELLDEHPEKFSSNVVLRPLMQDTLLPTAAYIAGPGEVSYFAQFKPLYSWFGIPMPVIYPRASATLIESRVEKVLEKYNLTIDDFAGDFEVLFRNVALEASGHDLEAAFKKAIGPIHGVVNSLKELAAKVDKSLLGSAEATRASLVKETEKFRNRLVQAEKRQQELVRSQLEKAESGLFPSGLQERSVSILYFLNKYGFDLVNRLTSELDLDTTKHQVVKL